MAQPKKKSPEPISYKLISIETVEYVYNKIPKSKAKTIEYNTKVRLKKKRGVKDHFVFLVYISAKIKNTSLQVAVLKTEYIYWIEGGSSYIKSKGNSIEGDPRLIWFLIAPCISASRGILTEKGRGTLLEKYPLPLITSEDIARK